MGVLRREIQHKDGSKTQYWYIRYALNGKDKWERIGKVGIVTKTVAQQKLEERKRQVRLGQLDMISTEIPTLSKFSKNYLEYHKDVKQKRSWKKDDSHLQRFNKIFGTKKLSEITARHIDDYKLNRLREVKPATVNRELEILRHLFYLAEKWNKFFGKNPVAKSGLLKVNNLQERILSYDEEKRLLQKCSPHLVPIVITALNTGMRKMEVLTLT